MFNNFINEYTEFLVTLIFSIGIVIMAIMATINVFSNAKPLLLVFFIVSLLCARSFFTYRKKELERIDIKQREFHSEENQKILKEKEEIRKKLTPDFIKYLLKSELSSVNLLVNQWIKKEIADKPTLDKYNLENIRKKVAEIEEGFKVKLIVIDMKRNG